MATKSESTIQASLTPVTTDLLGEKLSAHRISVALLRQALVSYHANLRHANADTKRRGEVSGGGKKPWRQKGTGRARVGSSRTPVWRGGGIVFGPTPERNYSKSITKTAKLQSLAASIKLKVKAGNVHLSTLSEMPTKTKLAMASIAPAISGGQVLIVVENITSARAFANITGAHLVTPQQLTAANISAARNIVFTGNTWDTTKAKFE